MAAWMLRGPDQAPVLVDLEGLASTDNARGASKVTVVMPSDRAMRRRKARVPAAKSGQSGDTIFDFLGVLGSGPANWGSGLQNVHRVFDSRLASDANEFANSVYS